MSYRCMAILMVGLIPLLDPVFDRIVTRASLRPGLSRQVTPSCLNTPTVPAPTREEGVFDVRSTKGRDRASGGKGSRTCASAAYTPARD